MRKRELEKRVKLLEIMVTNLKRELAIHLFYSNPDWKPGDKYGK